MIHLFRFFISKALYHGNIIHVLYAHVKQVYFPFCALRYCLIIIQKMPCNQIILPSAGQIHIGSMIRRCPSQQPQAMESMNRVIVWMPLNCDKNYGDIDFALSAHVLKCVQTTQRNIMSGIKKCHRSLIRSTTFFSVCPGNQWMSLKGKKHRGGGSVPVQF